MVKEKWIRVMITQDERWQKRYEEVEDFIEENKRNPSKYGEATEETGECWEVESGEDGGF